MADAGGDRWETAVCGLRERYTDVARQLAALTEEMHRLRLCHLVLEQLLAGAAAGDEGTTLMPVAPVPMLALRSGSVTSRSRVAAPPPPAPPPSVASCAISYGAAPKKTRSPVNEHLILARERAKALHKSSYDPGQRTRGAPAGPLHWRPSSYDDNNATRRQRRAGY